MAYSQAFVFTLINISYVRPDRNAHDRRLRKYMIDLVLMMRTEHRTWRERFYDGGRAGVADACTASVDVSR